MARIPTALIPKPHGREIPRDHGLDERAEVAAVLLGTMYPSQVVKRLVASYGVAIGTAYDDVARARAFLAGLKIVDRQTLFHDTDAQLQSIIMNPSVGPQDKLKAIQLRIGLHGLRRQPAREEGAAPLYDQEE